MSCTRSPSATGASSSAAGDPGLLTYLRSSAKPIQALPVARARPDLDDEQLALVCASHRATPEQLAVVRRILSDAPATEDDLECGSGPDADPPQLLGQARGVPGALSREKLDDPWVSARGAPVPGGSARRGGRAGAEVEPGSMPTGVDGCGVPTFALTLERSAHAFTRLAQADGGDRVVAAMRGHPGLLVGPVSEDARLIEVLDGWVAKGGAEGLFCAASAAGLGIALKVVDGSFRPLAAAVTHVLSLLGVHVEGLGGDEVRSSHGETVGSIRIAT